MRSSEAKPNAPLSGATVASYLEGNFERDDIKYWSPSGVAVFAWQLEPFPLAEWKRTLGLRKATVHCQ